MAAMLRWFALQYPGVGGVTIERAAELERVAAERVVKRLAVEVRDGKIGRCRSCGRSCPPWFPLCERCARSESPVTLVAPSGSGGIPPACIRGARLV